MSIEKRLEKLEKQNELIISLLTQSATRRGFKNEPVSTRSTPQLKKKDISIQLREQYLKQ